MQALRITETNKPADEIAALRAIIAERDQQIAQLTQHLESLHQQILNLRRMQFGASSERLAGQAQLFSGTVSLPLPPPPETEDVHFKRKKSNGRPSLPKDLPRRRVDYDLSEAEKAEFDAVERIGEEVSETVDYTPPVLTVVEHARAKYRCEKDGESTVRTASAEPSPLPKSNAGAGILAHVLVSKYQDHLPLNRQERMFARHGLALSKTTLCDWTLGAAELLSRLMKPLTAHVLRSGVVGADDTTLPLADPGRGKTRTARLWAYRGGGFKRAEDGVGWQAQPEAVVFEFTESREGLHPLRLSGRLPGLSAGRCVCRVRCLVPRWRYRRGRLLGVCQTQGSRWRSRTRRRGWRMRRCASSARCM